jgi:hypothetical protein
VAGFKLGKGRSIRRYTDEGEVASAVIEAGGDPYEKKLLGITAMQKLSGSRNSNSCLGLHEKPAASRRWCPRTTRDRDHTANTI